MNRLSYLSLAWLLFACNSKRDYTTVFKDPLLYAGTVHELNRVVTGNNFSSIVASRNYLYANIAGYEVIAAGYPGKFQSLVHQIRGLEYGGIHFHPTCIISSAYGRKVGDLVIQKLKMKL